MRFKVSLIILLCLATHVKAQNSPEEIVASFGEALSSWCNTNEIVYREKIDDLCSGARKCRVEDKIHAEYQKERGMTNYETFVLDSYMNMFQSLIPQSLNYQMSNIKVVGTDEMPEGTLTFITADIYLSGAINKRVTDLFLVRNYKITGIYSYSSNLGFSHLNGSLINALKLGRYKWTNGFKDGYAKVRNEAGHYGLIDLKGDVIIPCIWDDIIYEGGATFVTGYDFDSKLNVTYDLRKDGKRVPLYRVDTYKVGRLETPVIFSEGWATVRNKEWKYGYLKEDWDESEYDQVEYIFDDVTRFVDGYSYATYKGHGVILNKELEVVLHDNDKYHIVSNVRDGLVQVCNNSTGKFGFMNLSGEIVIQCVYNKVEDFSSGVSLIYNTSTVANLDLTNDAIHVYLKGPLGMINRHGDILLDCNYFVKPNYAKFDEGHIILFKKQENKFLSTLVGSDGKPLPGFVWDNYEILQPLYDGYALFANDYTFGYFNEAGQIVIDLTGKFTLASCFINGFANVGIRNEKQEAKYGCINKDGVNFIPCIYDNEFRFNEKGIALVLKDGKIGLIDIYGNSTFLD